MTGTPFTTRSCARTRRRSGSEVIMPPKRANVGQPRRERAVPATTDDRVETEMDAAARFQDVVSTVEGLEAILGRPHPRVQAKVVATLDKHCLAFIARSPFVLIASSDATGNLDVSPKGDPPGFVQVLDAKTLVIPERPGNRRADTFRNVLQNPRVGLIFFVPGKRETLRVGGDALIVRD